MRQKKDLQIKTEEDGNFCAEKYKIEIEVNILNTTLKVRGLGLKTRDVFSRTIGLANLRIIDPSDYRTFHSTFALQPPRKIERARWRFSHGKIIDMTP